MEPVGIGLILFSIVLFAVTLCFCTRIPQTAKICNQTGSMINESSNENNQKTIIIKLPGKDNNDDQYSIDLKVFLNKKDKQGEQEWKITDQRKTFYRRLDEYL